MPMSTVSARSCQHSLGFLSPCFGCFARFLGAFLLPCFGFFGRFSWLCFLGFGGLLTSLDLTCHLDDIVQCHGWLITTADTCTQCECLPESGISPLHLTQLTEHCGLNKIMQDGFFRNFEEAIRSSSVCGLVFVVSVWGGFCLLLPVFGGFLSLSFP